MARVQFSSTDYGVCTLLCFLGYKGRLVTIQQKCHLFVFFASFFLAVYFCIYTHTQLRILKFQDSVYLNWEQCLQTINKKKMKQMFTVTQTRVLNNYKTVLFSLTSRIIYIIKTCTTSLAAISNQNYFKIEEWCADD